jgi:hypothetical protein
MSSAERQLGVDLFNEVWRLIETREDDDRMLHATHAMAHHWGEAPECLPESRARGVRGVGAGAWGGGFGRGRRVEGEGARSRRRDRRHGDRGHCDEDYTTL